MAQEPVMDAPSVAGPKDLAAPNFKVGDSGPETFGAGVGRALQQTGDTLYTITQKDAALQNEAWARDNSVQAEIALAKERAQMGSLTGQAAIDYQDTYAKNITKIRQDYVNNAPNPDAKRMLDQQLARVTSYAIQDGIGHVKTETVRYNKQSQQARIDHASIAAQDLSLEDKEVEEKINSVKVEMHDAGAAAGAPPLDTENKISKKVSEMRKDRLLAMADSAPEAAARLYNRVKKDLVGDDAQTAQHAVWNGLAVKGAKSVATGVISGGPTDTQENKEKYALGQLAPIIGKIGAAGLVGGLLQESKLDPRAVAKGDAGDGSDSVGIAQVNQDRLNGKHGLLTFAKENSLDPNDFKTQIAHIAHELQTTHAGVAAELLKATSPEQAAAIANNKYEVSADSPTGNERQQRGYANRIAQAQRLAGVDPARAGLDPNEGPGDEARLVNEAEKDARQLASKYGMPDTYAEQMVQNAKSATIARYAQNKRVATDTYHGNVDTVENALNDPQHLFTNRSDLLASDPEVKKAFEALPAKKQMSYDQVIAKRLKDPNNYDPNMRTDYLLALGSQESDPKGFMQKSEALLEKNMPADYRARLMSERAKVRANGMRAADSGQITTYLGQAKQDGMFQDTAIADTKSEDYAKFNGALRLRVEAMTAANAGKKPTYEEVKPEISKLLRQMPGTAAHWFSSDKFGYEADNQVRQTIGAATYDKIEKQLKGWNRSATSDDVLQVYKRRAVEGKL